MKPGYEKVTCDRCSGSGRVPRGQAPYTLKSNRRMRPSCPKCGGHGFIIYGKVSPPIAAHPVADSAD